MNESDLKELRELFRARFLTHDFCIGKEETESFFRELLNEPQPARPVYEGKPIDPQLVAREMERMIPKLKEIFERDDLFYSRMFKK
jgi:hypothetical protein